MKAETMSESSDGDGTGPMTGVHRLRNAINAHDLEAVVDSFTTDFYSERPFMSSGSFTGNDNVRRNWAPLLERVPDVRAEILESVVDGSTAWVEWEQVGTERGGDPHHVRGVVVFQVRDDRIASVRFYLSAVVDGSTPKSTA